MLNKLPFKKLKLAKTHDFCASGEPKLTVVMLHGISSSSKTYDSALKYLEGTTSLKDIRFVTFDLLGSGESPKSDKLKYNFEEQLEALDNSIDDLKADGPIVLVGHSMGCLISIRYADLHRRKVRELILLSPPIYRPEDFENPIFAMGMENFRAVVIQKNPDMKTDKAFNNEMKYIICNPHNYAYYEKLTKRTTIIFGLEDQIIASFNIPKLLKANSLITAIETPGTHGVSHDKYSKMIGVLERILNETV